MDLAVVIVVMMVVFRHRELLLLRPPPHRIGQGQLLEISRIGHRNILAGDACDGRIEVIKGMCHDLGSDFAGHRELRGSPPLLRRSVLVFFTLCNTVAMSIGRMVRRSMTSASMPSAASFSAAASA